MRSSQVISLHYILLFISSLILAFHPLIWLVQTWTDPAYQSQGWISGLLVVGLFAWSLSSPKIHRHSRMEYTWAIRLLVIAMLVRMASQLLGINILAALTLALDVYAIARLLGVAQRQRALNPTWLAVLFLFSLPLEHVAQRVIGFSLQHISADLACSMLKFTSDAVTCEGVRILYHAQDVLIDLPCSGAKGLLLSMMIFTLLSSFRRHSITTQCIGFIVALGGAVMANAVRIVMLAVGIAFPDFFQGANVMLSPWHDLIGISALMLSLLPQLWWFSVSSSTSPSRSFHQPLMQKSVFRHSRNASISVVGLFLLTIVSINLPNKPVDTSSTQIQLTLPSSINGYEQEAMTLSDREQQYFTQFGGSANKAQFGMMNVLTVSTESPLRHLHTPEACITGAGLTAEYIGTDFSTPPSAIYKVTDLNAQQWHVAVTYVSEHGIYAANIAEVVWNWFTTDKQAWHMIQRITPWDADENIRITHNNALFAAMDLQPNATPIATALNKAKFIEFAAQNYL